MEYWAYFFWAYCFIGASKTVLVLTTFPAATGAAQAVHEESGISGNAILLIHIFTFIVTVCLSLFLWWVLLYRERWAFFAVYTEDDVVRDVTESTRDVL